MCWARGKWSFRFGRDAPCKSVGPGRAKPAHPPSLAPLAARHSPCGSVGPGPGEDRPTPLRSLRSLRGIRLAGQWGPGGRRPTTHLRALRSLRGVVSDYLAAAEVDRCAGQTEYRRLMTDAVAYAIAAVGTDV